MRRMGASGWFSGCEIEPVEALVGCTYERGREYPH